MLLPSRTGDFVELFIDGYQFGESPAASTGGWDEHWLQIAGRVRRGGESWVFRDPCLTTWEAHELLGWLRRAVEYSPESIDFVEPNLAFDATSNDDVGTTIVVTLRAEAAPPTASDEIRWGRGCGITLDMSAASLRAAASAWENDLMAHRAR